MPITIDLGNYPWQLTVPKLEESLHLALPKQHSPLTPSYKCIHTRQVWEVSAANGDRNPEQSITHQKQRTPAHRMPLPFLTEPNKFFPVRKKDKNT